MYLKFSMFKRLSNDLGKIKFIIIALILICFHIMPWFVPDYFIHIGIMMFLYSLMGQGWDILGGYTGQFSFGHALFFGIGAYISSLLFVNLGLTPWVGMIIACLSSIFVALFIGFISFRYKLSGPYFALIMLAFAQIFYITFYSWDLVGGAHGILIPLKGTSIIFMQFMDKKPIYFICLWMMLGGIFFVWKMEKSRMGLYFRAIRENMDAAEALGVNSFKYQMVAIAISAAMTSLGGTIYAQYLLYIDPETTFGVMNSVEIMIRPLIGGPGTVLGPLLGSALLTPLSEITRQAFQSYSGVYLMIYGVVLVIIMMFIPEGVLGIFKKVSKISKRGKK